MPTYYLNPFSSQNIYTPSSSSSNPGSNTNSASTGSLQSGMSHLETNLPSINTLPQLTNSTEFQYGSQPNLLPQSFQQSFQPPAPGALTTSQQQQQNLQIQQQQQLDETPQLRSKSLGSTLTPSPTLTTVTPSSNSLLNSNNATGNQAKPAGNSTTTYRRPRRRSDQIERYYKCNFENCTKSYGTLNHLNAHISFQNHGERRKPHEFKDIKRQFKAKRKEQSTFDVVKEFAINNNLCLLATSNPATAPSLVFLNNEQTLAVPFTQITDYSQIEELRLSQLSLQQQQHVMQQPQQQQPQSQQQQQQQVQLQQDPVQLQHQQQHQQFNNNYNTRNFNPFGASYR